MIHFRNEWGVFLQRANKAIEMYDPVAEGQIDRE